MNPALAYALMPVLVWIASVIGILALAVFLPNPDGNGMFAENIVWVLGLGMGLNLCGWVFLRFQLYSRRKHLQAETAIAPRPEPEPEPEPVSVSVPEPVDPSKTVPPKVLPSSSSSTPQPLAVPAVGPKASKELLFQQDLKDMLGTERDFTPLQLAIIREGWKIVAAVTDQDLPLRLPISVIVQNGPVPGDAPRLDFPLLFPKQAFIGLFTPSESPGEEGTPGKLRFSENGFQLECGRKTILIPFDRISYCRMFADRFSINSVILAEEVVLVAGNPSSLILLAQRWYERGAGNSP